MKDHKQRLSIVHLMLVVVWVAIAFSVMPASGATVFAVASLVFCLVTGLWRAPVSEMFVAMACVFAFVWFLFSGVEAARKTASTRSIHRTVPAPAK